MVEKLNAVLICFVLLTSMFLISGGDSRAEINEEIDEHLNPERNEEVRENDTEKSYRDTKIARDHRDWPSTVEGFSEPSKNYLPTELKLRDMENRFVSPSLNNYTSREPIRIDNNSDFDEQAAEEGWEGDGTEEDPYIIEGYEIDGESHGFSVYIGNVTHHFEVRDCLLYNASDNQREYFKNNGLYLYNSSNGKIYDNVVSNNRGAGIHLKYSSENLISQNHALSNIGHDIFLERSMDNTVIDNDVVSDDSSELNLNDQSDPDYCTNTVLVKLEDPSKNMLNHMDFKSALNSHADEVADRVEGRTERLFYSFKMAQISLNGEVEVKEAVNILKNTQGVLHAEPNYIVKSLNVPNDPGFPSLWGMSMIDAPGAWNVTTGDEETVVAVIDTGVDYNHEDLKDNMWTSEEGHHGYNAIQDNNDPMDDTGHGTHVAGTIGAVGDNELGVVGVNWNVSLMGVKFMDQMGFGTISHAIAGLEYVLERKNEGENIAATTNSWGGGGYSQLLYDAIEQHQKEGILFVAAAGNSRSDNDINPAYPASYNLTNIISVAATGETDQLGFFSNYGSQSVHVGAPGVDINSTMLDDSYMVASGTSMAAPHVSGLAALLASHNSSYDYNNLKNIILSSADPVESLKNKTLTEGRINASRALRLTPDPDDIRFWVHQPGSVCWWREETVIEISLNDGVNPVLGANVSVTFSTGEDTIDLMDDGIGENQVKDDGYYSGKWNPEFTGEVILTITIEKEDLEITRDITVNVRGESGVTLLGSEQNTIINNTISGKDYGIVLYDSERNELVDNNFGSLNRAGIRLYKSKHNEINNHTLMDFQGGYLEVAISFESSNDNTVSDNMVSNTALGIEFIDSKNNHIINNTLIDNYAGIWFEGSHHNSLVDNNVSYNQFDGITMVESNNNILLNNTAFVNWAYGIQFASSHNNTLTSNNISDSIYGIIVGESDNNSFYNNTFGGNEFSSIYLMESRLIKMDNNTMIDVGIYIEGSSKEYWNTHSIDTSNEVNEKPVYYWKNETEGTVPTGGGQIILANCTQVTIEGDHISYTNVGILMGFSHHNTIRDNTVTSVSWEGITSYHSDHNQFINNTVIDNTYPGMYLVYSNNNVLLDNNLSNNGYGIYFVFSDNNRFEDNNVSSNFYEGIAIVFSNGNTIENNTVNWNGWEGIFILMSDENTVSDNTVVGNLEMGIALALSDGNEIIQNEGSHNSYGIYIEEGDSNIIYGNTLYLNDVAIHLRRSHDNDISDNYASQNHLGITLLESDGNAITNNNASKNWNGIRLTFSNYNELNDNMIFSNNNTGLLISIFSENNLLMNNTSSNNTNGIFILRSDNNIVEENTVISNSKYSINLVGTRNTTLDKNTLVDGGIYIEGEELENWNTHTINDSNQVNGKPVYYWKNEYGGTVPIGAGQVILANCTHVNIEDQNLSHSSIGILLGFSDHTDIQYNTVSYNKMDGIHLYEANNNTITNNSVERNEGHGIKVMGSNHNIIYHNKFINNTNQAFDDGDNSWNAPYPISGNYWSDWTGPDEYSGPGQNEPGSDGIVDFPYEIEGTNVVDYYPWTIPDGWTFENPSVSLTNPTGGETLSSGMEEEITWYTEEGTGNITSIDLEYSDNGGTTWDTIVSDIEDTGSYLWEVPEEPTVNGMIRITVRDDNNLQGMNNSDVFEVAEAEFEYGELIIDDTSVGPGENVSLSVVISNVGRGTGIENVSLRVDGLTIDSQEVMIEAGSNETVEFIWSHDEPGDYTLEIWSGTDNTRKFQESVKILEPASFDYSSFSVEPTEVIAGENITISTSVINFGEMEGDEIIELRIDGSVVDTKNMTFAPYQGERIEFIWSYDEPGIYDMEIWSGTQEEEKFNQTVTLLKPAEFVYSDFSVDTTEVEPGDNITLSMSILNIGEVEGTETVDMKVNGESVDSKQLLLAPYGGEVIEFVWSTQEPGTYHLEIWSGTQEEEKFNQTVVILKPTEFIYSDFIVDPQEIFVGEEVNISITVTNIGEVEGTKDVELIVDEEVVDIFQLTLVGGENETVRFTWSEEEPGEYIVEIEQFNETVTVKLERDVMPTSVWIGLFILLILAVGAIGFLVFKSFCKRKRAEPEDVDTDDDAGQDIIEEEIDDEPTEAFEADTDEEAVDSSFEEEIDDEPTEVFETDTDEKAVDSSFEEETVEEELER